MKKIFILIAILLFIFIISGCSKKELTLNQIQINNKVVNLKKEDVLTIDYWNDDNSITFNKKDVKKVSLFNDLKIGDSIDDVISKMNLKSGYALINTEVPTEEGDGTTDVIDIEYIDRSSFDYEFLDALIIVGYKLENNQWIQIPFDELEELLNSNNVEDVLIYMIDINGFDDISIEENHVIEIVIKRY